MVYFKFFCNTPIQNGSLKVYGISMQKPRKSKMWRNNCASVNYNKTQCTNLYLKYLINQTIRKIQKQFQ